VISVTMIHAGEATNVVPDSAEIRGTVRTFSVEVLDMIQQRMREVAEHTCAAFGARCEFEFHRNYPPTVNHAAETAFVQRVLGTVVVGPTTWCPSSPPWAPRTSATSCRPSRAATSPSATATARTATAATARPVHAAQPQLRLQRRADPAGRHAWVRIAEEWLAAR
jgi:metal-dependent amidase/aminoacylase/carboxypeptidase family protein